jgi:iron-sulfur cluster repair protein YtfE (RIC family)
MAQNVIDMLKEDHDRVRKLLSELVESTERAEKKRAQLLETIEKELKIHTLLEEEIFYPAFKDAGGKDNARMYYEALEEHRAVEELILPDLKNTDPTSVEFSGRAKVLKEMVEHHASEEEQELFPLARKSMSEKQLTELAELVKERKAGVSA